MLFAVALCAGAWLAPGGQSHAALVDSGSAGLGNSNLNTASDGDGPDRAGGESFLATVLAMPATGGDVDAAQNAPAVDWRGTTLSGSGTLPSPEFTADWVAKLVAAASERFADAAGFEIGPVQSSLDSFWILSSSYTTALLDEPIAKSAETNDNPFWIVNGDLYLKVAVPVLAVLALFVAGLLMREILRRHRRAALVRRIKRNSGRSGRRRPFNSTVRARERIRRSP